MKRTLLAIVAAFLMMTSAYAQRLANVRAEATLITDKMVLELGLSNAQRNGILNINLNISTASAATATSTHTDGNAATGS